MPVFVNNMIYQVARNRCIPLPPLQCMHRFSAISEWDMLPRFHLWQGFLLFYTGCPRRNVPDFGRVFLMLKYTDITQNTYVQSWTVTEIMARKKVWSSCGSIHCTCQLTILSISSPWVWCHMTTIQLSPATAMLRHRWAFSCIVLGTLRTTMTWMRVFL